MPVTYRPWISPYGDDDFDWAKEEPPDLRRPRFCLRSGADRFSWAVDPPAGHETPTISRAAFHGSRRVVWPGRGNHLHSPEREMPHHFYAPSKFRGKSDLP